MKYLFGLLVLSGSLMGADFAWVPEYTANGYGRIVMIPQHCKAPKATLQVCNVSVAMQALMRKSDIVGQQIYLIVWNCNEVLQEAHTPCFDTSDSCFQKVRREVLTDPMLHCSYFFTLLNKNNEPIGSAVFIGPMNLGVCDPNNQLHILSEADIT